MVRLQRVGNETSTYVGVACWSEAPLRGDFCGFAEDPGEWGLRSTRVGRTGEEGREEYDGSEFILSFPSACLILMHVS